MTKCEAPYVVRASCGEEEVAGVQFAVSTNSFSDVIIYHIGLQTMRTFPIFQVHCQHHCG